MPELPTQRPKDQQRIDPADADGMFRRALRETGATALTRGLMWGGVRAASISGGRYGSSGPSRWVKLAQLAGITALGALTVLLPTGVAFAGLVLYWFANWIVAVAWRSFETRTFGKDFRSNWPWWPAKKPAATTGALPERLLVVLQLGGPGATLLLESISDGRVAEADVDAAIRVDSTPD